MSEQYPATESAGNAEPIDLAHLEEEFEQAEVQESDYEPIPDGKYQVVVEEAFVTRARSSGNPMLKWKLKVIGPTHRGRILWRNSVMASADNLKWLKTDLHLCGLDLSKLSDLQERASELAGVRIEITKRTRGENENVYFNRKIVTEDAGEGFDEVASAARMPF